MALINGKSEDFWIGFDDETQELFITDLKTRNQFTLKSQEIEMIQKLVRFYKGATND